MPQKVGAQRQRRARRAVDHPEEHRDHENAGGREQDEPGAVARAVMMDADTRDGDHGWSVDERAVQDLWELQPCENGREKPENQHRGRTHSRRGRTAAVEPQVRDLKQEHGRQIENPRPRCRKGVEEDAPGPDCPQQPDQEPS